MNIDANADARRPVEDPSSGRRRKPEQTASSAAKKARLDSNSVALEEQREQGGRPPDDELTRPAHGEEKVNFVWSVFGLHVATDRVWLPPAVSASNTATAPRGCSTTSEPVLFATTTSTTEAVRNRNSIWCDS